MPTSVNLYDVFLEEQEAQSDVKENYECDAELSGDEDDYEEYLNTLFPVVHEDEHPHRAIHPLVDLRNPPPTDPATIYASAEAQSPLKKSQTIVFKARKNVGASLKASAKSLQ